MKVHVLFIKRHFSDPNDDAEAYTACDEQTDDENPEWRDKQAKEMLNDCGSDMVGGKWQWITLDVSSATVNSLFSPVIPAEVVK